MSGDSKQVVRPLELENHFRVVAQDAGMEALEEIKRRVNALYKHTERCNHVNEILATIYWLQHQIKIGEVLL